MKKSLIFLPILLILTSCETYLKILESRDDCPECQAAAAFYRANEEAILLAMNPVADTVYLPVPCEDCPEPEPCPQPDPCPDCPQPEPCPECIPEQIVIRDTVEIEVPKVCPECPEPEPCPSCPPSKVLHNYYEGLVLYHGFPVSQLSFDYTENHHGTYQGVTVFDTKANFNGSSMVVVPFAEQLNLGDQITIMADFYMTQPGQSAVSNIICKANNTSGNHSWGLAVNSSRRLRFRLVRGTNSADYFPQTVLQLNTWYRVIAFWQSGSPASVWIKNMDTGEIMKEQNTVNLGGNITPGQYNVSIGGSTHSPVDRFFHGQMDHVALWERRLTNDELDELLDFGYTWHHWTGNVPPFQTQAVTVPAGKNLTLEAIPNIGWQFSHWSQADTIFSQSRILNIQMPPSDLNLTANYVRNN